MINPKNDSEPYRLIGSQNDGKGAGERIFSPVIFLIVLLFLAISLSNCATRYMPQPTDVITVVDNYALLETDSVAFAISPRVWTREPQRISDLFTTFHVIVKNQTRQKISISPNDIFLLDEERNQYDILSVYDVADILFYDNFMMDKFSTLPERYQQVTGDRLTARANLMQEAFHYGDIMPGARKSGFIFFRRLSPRNRMSIIVFQGEEIVFIRE